MSTVCYVDFENLYNSLEKEYGLRLTGDGYSKLKNFLTSEFSIEKASDIKLFAIWDFFQHVKRIIARFNMVLVDSVINAPNSTDGKMVVELLINSNEYDEIVILSGDGLFLHPAIYLSEELKKKVSFVALKKSCCGKFEENGFKVHYLEDLFEISGYQATLDEHSFENTQVLLPDLEVVLHKVVHMVKALNTEELALIGVAHQVHKMRNNQGKTNHPFNNVGNIIPLILEGCQKGIFIKGTQPHPTKTGTQETIKLNHENLYVRKMKRTVDSELNGNV